MTDDERWFSRLKPIAYKIKSDLLPEFLDYISKASDGGSWSKPFSSAKHTQIKDMGYYWLVVTFAADYPYVHNQINERFSYE